MYSISEICLKLCCYITLLLCVKPLGVTQFKCHQVECYDIQRHACKILQASIHCKLIFLQLQSLLRHPMVHPYDMISEHAFGSQPIYVTVGRAVACIQILAW